MRARSGRDVGPPCAARGWAAAAAVLLATFLLPPVAEAQEVTFTPRPDRPAERRLDQFLEAGGFRIVSQDTVVASGDTIRGDVLVLGANLRSAGVVEGHLFAVTGDVFLRPGASVTGDVIVLSGGWYTSEQASVAGTVTYRPNLLLRIVPRNGSWQIFHPREELPAVELDGLSGLHAPVYRRVDGWTFGWGGTLRATDFPAQPSLSGAVRFHTEGAEQLEGTLRASLYPTGSLRIGLAAERRTRTMDGWIRGDLANSASYLLGLGDFRNYYRAERVVLEAASTAAEGWAPSVALQWEEARSLEARPLDVLFEDDEDVRPNPPVDPGRITSVQAGLTFRERTPEGRFTGRFGLEAADSAVAGDFSFLAAEAQLAWRRRILSGHRLEMLGLARWDLSGRLPGQRWSDLGGTGSLPTLEPLARRGPRLAFASATWLMPVDALSVPVLGAPRFFLRHALGNAWAEGQDFDLRADVVAGVRFLFVEAGVALDVTAEEAGPELVLGVGFPGRFRP